MIEQDDRLPAYTAPLPPPPSTPPPRPSWISQPDPQQPMPAPAKANGTAKWFLIGLLAFIVVLGLIAWAVGSDPFNTSTGLDEKAIREDQTQRVLDELYRVSAEQSAAQGGAFVFSMQNATNTMQSDCFVRDSYASKEIQRILSLYAQEQQQAQN